MIRSMTGFGEAEQDLADVQPPLRLRVQLKTVNHRFFNASVRVPGGLDRLEPAILKRLRGRIGRGHVNCALSVDRQVDGAEGPGPELDLGRARAYVEGLRQAGQTLELLGDVTLSDLVRYSDIFRAPDPQQNWRELLDEDRVLPLVDQALDDLVAMREREGERLAEDLAERLEAIASLTDQIQGQAPERLHAERDRLRAAVADLAADVPVDEERLAREIAYLAEKWDLNEELVRLRSHVALFRETLALPDSEPVGKRLGFVLQEFNREANTIASKANDAEIARWAVGLKEEIERLREQVENVE